MRRTTIFAVLLGSAVSFASPITAKNAQSPISIDNAHYRTAGVKAAFGSMYILIEGLAPILFGEAEPQRNSWAYFTENELSPGAVRVGPWKAVFNIRGDNGARAGSEAPAAQFGWRGAEQYVATVPQVFNLWEDPMERYDIFMTTGRENTWTVPSLLGEAERVVKTYIEYPPRPVQSESYSGPLTLSQYHRFSTVREQLEKDGFKLSLPTGN